MRYLALALAIVAAPVAADPLGLIDYEAFFAADPDNIEEVSEILQILEVGPVTLLHDRTEDVPYTGVDESGQGAVGCFVGILVTIQSVDLVADLADASFTPDSAAEIDVMLQVSRLPVSNPCL